MVKKSANKNKRDHVTKSMTSATTPVEKMKWAQERDMGLREGDKPKAPEPQEKSVTPKSESHSGMKQVMAISKGFYGNCKIRRGQKFYIPKKEKLGQWMVPADQELPSEEGFKLHGQASKASPAFLEKPGQLKEDLNRAIFAE